jgi:hypothetical protein
MRNILYSVYGLESGAVNLNEVYMDYPVIKTHLLTRQLDKELLNNRVIYLMRDGRDSVISSAYRRINMLEEEGSLHHEITGRIILPGDLRYEGWGFHILDWLNKADHIIRFEDLVMDPALETTEVERKFSLGQGDMRRIPTFSFQKLGNARYGNIGGSQLFFRKGKVGEWIEEMDDFQKTLFWNVYGEVASGLGYAKDGSHATREEFLREVQSFRAYLKKPFKQVGLIKKMRRIVDRHMSEISK